MNYKPYKPARVSFSSSVRVLVNQRLGILKFEALVSIKAQLACVRCIHINGGIRQDQTSVSSWQSGQPLGHAVKTAYHFPCQCQEQVRPPLLPSTEYPLRKTHSWFLRSPSKPPKPSPLCLKPCLRASLALDCRLTANRLPTIRSFDMTHIFSRMEISHS